MQLHQISRKTKLAKKKIIGRGGKRGTTSGKGTKGQKARSGHRIRPEIRDMIKKIPKMRGRGKNLNTSIQAKPAVVPLTRLMAIWPKGGEINPQILAEAKAVRSRGGSIPVVKILSGGEVKVKFNITGCLVSTGARQAIEAAGGSVKA